MNSEFWNIFQWISNGFSDRIPIGTVPSPVGHLVLEDNRPLLKRVGGNSSINH
jgi:hypothetical protein